MNKQSVIDGLSKISAVMTENKEYLISRTETEIWEFP